MLYNDLYIQILYKLIKKKYENLFSIQMFNCYDVFCKVGANYSTYSKICKRGHSLIRTN